MATPRFDITFDSPADVDLFDGSGAEVRFVVSNPDDEARGIALRVAVMNTIGQENRNAAELAWFSLDAPADPQLPAGGSVDCAVRAVVPKGTGKQKLVWALVACDAELGDDLRAYSQPLCLDVKNVEPDPARTGSLPWWVWLILAVAAAAIIIAVVLGAGG